MCKKHGVFSKQRTRAIFESLSHLSTCGLEWPCQQRCDGLINAVDRSVDLVESSLHIAWDAIHLGGTAAVPVCATAVSLLPGEF